MNDTNKTDKRNGRNGEYGKLRKCVGRQQAANRKSRKDAKNFLRKSV
jgi:hypothetical protein